MDRRRLCYIVGEAALLGLLFSAMLAAILAGR